MIQHTKTRTRLRLFIVEGDSEAEMTDRLQAIDTCATEARCGGAHCAVIVADSPEQAGQLSHRAIGRLSRRPGKPIQDVSGIYYAPQPLAATGGVAWLFPGEGSQYLGMLSGIQEDWPEISAILRSIDLAGGQIGGELRSLSYFIDGWQNRSTREEAESQLRRIDNAMFSVLSASWCLREVAGTLSIPMNAVAGHSAGELAALMVSGAMDTSADIALFAKAMHDMEVQSKDSRASLLAVSAAADRVEAVVNQVLQPLGLESQAMVAMDNCPHQSVVVGLRSAVEKLTDPFAAEGWLVERLVLEQPYHTPMFAEVMDPLREAFNRVNFRTPSVPVYACATGERFPDTGDQMREISLMHWQSRVRFRELVDRMYADGSRIFLEVGPKGNISSFVADTLRGKPHATIPMDTARIPICDQIVHAAAQLAAQHVTFDMSAIHPERRSLANQETVKPTDATGTIPAARVVEQHLQTMQQLLTGQSEVMQRYLANRRQLGRARNARRQPVRNRKSRIRQASQSTLSSELQPSAEHGIPHAGLPMLGDVMEYRPGAHLIMHRVLDPRVDHYATHHTVGGREVSAIKPDQCGLPVMPMTFTLEMMMEAALQLVPACVVRAISRVQLSRWLAFYLRDPITIRIEATRMESTDEDAERVLVRVLDLGNHEEPWIEKPKLAAVATVELTEDYPDPPVPKSIALTDPEPCTTSLQTMYNNLFHGELFQGVTHLGTIGKEGIESTIVTLPRDELFSDRRQANFLGDPVLLDVAMHPNAAWHLEQPDQSGRIMLPFEVRRVEFFGGRPDVGDQFACHGMLDEQSPRHFMHSVETIDQHGRVWNRIHGVRLWRFYLPFHEVNFHGPKNVYHLSEEFSVPGYPDVATARFRWLDDLSQPTLLRAAAEVLLSDEEYEDFLNFSGPHETRVQWVFGCVVAKDAVRRWWFKHHGQRLYMADIVIRNHAGQITATPRRSSRRSPDDIPPADAQFPFVAIAHRSKQSLGIASDQSLEAIDLFACFESS